MASKITAQDVLVCDLCETSPVQMYCNKCETNLCKGCVGEHMLDSKRSHDVVIYKLRNQDPIFPDCEKHSKQRCDRYCRQCNTPICTKCISSGSHKKHDVTELLELFNSHKKILTKKTKELQTSVYPLYERNISKLQDEIARLPENYEKFMSAISKQGEDWHQAVDVIINRHKQEVQKMKTDDLAALKKLLEDMKKLLSTLHQAIGENNDLLKTNNIIKIMNRKPQTAEFSKPPPDVEIELPSFTPAPIQEEQLCQMFGTMKMSSIPRERSYRNTTAQPDTHLLNISNLTSIIFTEFTSTYGEALESIACHNSYQVWACGSKNEIKCFTTAGFIQETIITKTGNTPWGLSVTRQGDLIYTDYNDRSINRIRHRKIEKIITIQDWRPWTVCCTDSDDLLIGMTKAPTPSRVVHYSGSIEKRVIQFDDQGKPLFSSGNRLPITENSSKDIICVSDPGKNIVVVLNQAGKLRCRYEGNLSSQKYKSFSPSGVVIDSMGHILVADYCNHCIHIIDQQGHFIRYILENSQLRKPYDLSLDRNNTLYVAEGVTALVKVIKYLK